MFPQVRLKLIVIREMLHDLFHAAVENIAELIDGVDFHIFVLAQAIQLWAVYIVVRIQGILRNAAVFHGFP